MPTLLDPIHVIVIVKPFDVIVGLVQFDSLKWKGQNSPSTLSDDSVFYSTSKPSCGGGSACPDPAWQLIGGIGVCI